MGKLEPTLAQVTLLDIIRCCVRQRSQLEASLEQVKRWKELGFVVLRQAFEPAAVQTLATSLERNVAAHQRRREGRLKAWSRRMEPKRARWSAQLLAHSGIFRGLHEGLETAWANQCDRWGIGPDWGGLCCSFRQDSEERSLLLGSSAMRQAQAICDQELVLFFSHYWSACPGYEIHVDDFRAEGLAAHNFIGMWTALDEINADNGSLIVLPGSHLSDERVEAEILELNAGDVVIWDGRLRHGSGQPRVQGLSRRAIGCHLAHRKAQTWPAGAIEAQSTGYWLKARLRTQI
ncbi:MAG TPA: hypothetical protein DCQ06_00970, partial [Myxococcales bacterium]|nr:hypothetical protein [Myxococcales bacterium]